MSESLEKLRSENILKTYYRKLYWKFIFNAKERAYMSFCRIVNPEVPYSKDSQYYKWLIKNYCRKSDLLKLKTTVNSFSYTPLISIIVPIYNTPENFLRDMIESVLSQVYPHWELCICDDASLSRHVQEILGEYTAKDLRIKVVRHATNKHISHASNSAIAIASGEFISLLDHDDLLTPDALYEVVSLLNQHPEADMIYSDEDKILPDRSLAQVFFKQDWCPDSFLARMYTCHLGTYRLSIIKEIGGFRSRYEGSQDYDLVLRFTERTDRVFHIPKILYHWRIHPESTSGGIDAKPYAANATKAALNDALSRRGELGVVTSSLTPGCCTIRYDITEYKLVSIIVYISSSAVDLERCLNSIFTKSSYQNYEAILVDNSSNDLNIIKVINDWLQKEPSRCKFYSLDKSLNYSELINYAVEKSSGNYILFLNSALEVITPDWVQALIEQVQRVSIGASGALILNSDDTINHAGIVIGHEEIIGYSHQGAVANTVGYCGCVGVNNNYSAVSIHCLMCERQMLDNIGGFDRELSCDELSGVDVCLKMLEKGYRNIYLPHVILRDWTKKDTTSASIIIERLPQEADYFQNKWQKFIDRDPCHNPHLILVNGCYVIK